MLGAPSTPGAHMLRRTAALATAGALALGGVALLVPTAAGAVGTAPSAAQPQHKKLLTPAERRELRETGHVTITRQTKRHGTVTIAVQRGSVTAVSPTSISLTSKDGYSHTYRITDATKVR